MTDDYRDIFKAQTRAELLADRERYMDMLNHFGVGGVSRGTREACPQDWSTAKQQAARVKRGPEAFAKKAERRADPEKIKCNVCGTPTRPQKLEGGVCPKCIQAV